MSSENQVTVNIEDFPFTLNKKGSFLEFYSKKEKKISGKKEEPVFNMYLWNEEEVDRIYSLNRGQVLKSQTLKESKTPLIKRFIKGIWGAIYRKLFLN